MRQIANIGAGLLCFASCGAQAETLTVSGWYAAGNRDVAFLRSLAIDRFGGNEGATLEPAVERMLVAARDRDNQPYFIVRSGYANNIDGVVNGTMQVRVENNKFKKKVKRCAADTDSTDCKSEQKVDIELKCQRRIVSAAVDVKVVRTEDDATIYTRSLPQRNEREYCEDDDLPPGVDTVVMPFINTVVGQLREDFVPYGATQKIRIRESRTGMSKTDSNQMKSLIAATKTSEAAACAGWKEMEGRGVAHATLGFNLGLCAESAGELDEAMRYYRSLAAAKPASDVSEAISRVERRLAGEEDDRARAGL